MKHALKIEDLDLDIKTADKIVSAFKEFAEELGYSEDRIEELECRSRDGFSAYSHNKGGVSCAAFMDQYTACMERTGFKNADKTLDQYQQYDIDYFVEEHEYPKDYSKWTDAQLEAFDASRNEDSEATVLFGLDIMYKGKEGTKHQANLRFTVCVKDSPYHRQYDDLISIDIEWRFARDLTAKLAKILKLKDVQKFSSNLRGAY